MVHITKGTRILIDNLKERGTRIEVSRNLLRRYRVTTYDTVNMTVASYSRLQHVLLWDGWSQSFDLSVSLMNATRCLIYNPSAVRAFIKQQRGWVTPQQWREWELGRRQRAGELVVKMGHIDMVRAARVVEHVTMDESTGAWYAHLRGVKYPVEIILLHSLFVEFAEKPQ